MPSWILELVWVAVESSSSSTLVTPSRQGFLTKGLGGEGGQCLQLGESSCYSSCPAVVRAVAERSTASGPSYKFLPLLKKGFRVAVHAMLSFVTAHWSPCTCILPYVKPCACCLLLDSLDIMIRTTTSHSSPCICVPTYGKPCAVCMLGSLQSGSHDPDQWSTLVTLLLCSPLWEALHMPG